MNVIYKQAIINAMINLGRLLDDEERVIEGAIRVVTIYLDSL